jgi:hypothetical protein
MVRERARVGLSIVLLVDATCVNRPRFIGASLDPDLRWPKGHSPVVVGL